MHNPLRAELVIDLQQNVLRMRFQQETSLAHDLDPALEDRKHDLLDNERYRLGTDVLNHLDQQRQIVWPP